MTFPAAVTSHHTIWIGCATSGCQPHPVRYSVDGERLVCFGDGVLSDVADGTRVRAAVHEIAGGPVLAEFGATVRTATDEKIDSSAFVSLLDHVSLGRDAVEVERSLAKQRSSRRLLIIQP